MDTMMDGEMSSLYAYMLVNAEQQEVPLDSKVAARREPKQKKNEVKKKSTIIM